MTQINARFAAPLALPGAPPKRRFAPWGVPLVVAAFLGACGGDHTNPTADTSASAAPPPPPTASAPASATAEPTASASAPAPSASAAPKPPDYDPANKAKPPIDSEELQARARGLFDAVVQNNAALGEDMWFPKEPFLILKDIKDPGKYWDQLHRAFVKDVEKLHKKRKNWEGTEFVKFEPGAPPKWVKPGDEGNKIGYYRTVKGNLVYKAEGKVHKLEVRVMISWQNRWFITHLGKFK
ncbi:MAG: hypothetical protein IPK82_40485 [Polyangiaceae bacterium]|nr:hypothetical protein [Polyangiaceae bacterium]